MVKKAQNMLYTGIIIELIVDTDIDEILQMQVKQGESIKLVYYHEALYSQLDRRNIGAEILQSAEITLFELKSEKYIDSWERYKREHNDDGRALEATNLHGARRLFIHVLKGNIQCLVVAKDLEVLCKVLPLHKG